MAHRYLYEQICGDSSMNRVNLIITDFDRDGISQNEKQMFETYWDAAKARGAPSPLTVSTANSPEMWDIVNDRLTREEEVERVKLEADRKRLKDALNVQLLSPNLEKIRQSTKTLLVGTWASLTRARLDPQQMRAARIRAEQEIKTIHAVIENGLGMGNIGSRFLRFITRTVADLVLKALRRGRFAWRMTLLYLPVSPRHIDFFPLEAQSNETASVSVPAGENGD
jgi:hypothetical protein